MFVFGFSTSKTELFDIYFEEFYPRTTSHELPNNLRIASEEIKRFKKSLEIGLRYSLVPSFPSTDKELAIPVKNYAKKVIEAFSSCPMLLDFFPCSK